MDIGEAGEGLERRLPDGEALADFGEDLADAGVVVGVGLLEIAGIGDRARGVDLAEGVAAAEADVARAKAGAGVEGDQRAIDIAGAGQIVDVGAGLRVAERGADQPVVDVHVDAGDDAAQGGVDG